MSITSPSANEESIRGAVFVGAMLETHIIKDGEELNDDDTLEHVMAGRPIEDVILIEQNIRGMVYSMLDWEMLGEIAADTWGDEEA